MKLQIEVLEDLQFQNVTYQMKNISYTITFIVKRHQKLTKQITQIMPNCSPNHVETNYIPIPQTMRQIIENGQHKYDKVQVVGSRRGAI